MSERELLNMPEGYAIFPRSALDPTPKPKRKRLVGWLKCRRSHHDIAFWAEFMPDQSITHVEKICARCGRLVGSIFASDPSQIAESF